MHAAYGENFTPVHPPALSAHSICALRKIFNKVQRKFIYVWLRPKYKCRRSHATEQSEEVPVVMAEACRKPRCELHKITVLWVVDKEGRSIFV